MVRVLALLAACALLPPTGVQATELRILLQPPVDTPSIGVRRAELLLSWWGSTERVPLEVTGEGVERYVRVPLDEAVWTSLKAKQPPDSASIYVEFTGAVPVLSESFAWLGAPGPPLGEATHSTVISFRRVEPVIVRDGEHVEIRLALRRPVSRQLRFVDERNVPVTDITVSGEVFWTAHNDCGAPVDGMPLFDDMRPNRDGILTVPDGDVVYGFDIGENFNLAVLTPAPLSPDRLYFTASFDSAEQIVRLHRQPRVPLRLQVLIGGRPAEGVVVTIEGPEQICRYGAGEKVRTNVSGLVERDEFYPDQVRAMCVADDADRPIWIQSRFDGLMSTVDLPAGTRTGVASRCTPSSPASVVP